MAQVHLRGKVCQVQGELPNVGQQAPDFSLRSNKLKEKDLASFSDASKLIYTVPSLDTMTCHDTTVTLNELATELTTTQVIVVSADLPFAQQRFAQKNKLKKNVTLLSMMNNPQFAIDYGILLADGPLAGLAARAIFVLDGDNKVLHTELVNEISDSPDFSLGIKSL